MPDNNYETMMDVAAEIRDALKPRFLQLTLLGKEKEKVLVNIANVAAVKTARQYIEPFGVVGAEVVLNHAAADGSESYRVSDTVEDIKRGMRHCWTLWYPCQPPKPFEEEFPEDDATPLDPMARGKA